MHRGQVWGLNGLGMTNGIGGGVIYNSGGSNDAKDRKDNAPTTPTDTAMPTNGGPSTPAPNQQPNGQGHLTPSYTPGPGGGSNSFYGKMGGI